MVSFIDFLAKIRSKEKLAGFLFIPLSLELSQCLFVVSDLMVQQLKMAGTEEELIELIKDKKVDVF